MKNAKGIIPVGLPKEVKIAHKTGSITGVLYDSGIVFFAGWQKICFSIIIEKS